MTLKDRKEVPLDDTWNLTPLYSSEDAWKAHLTEANSRCPEILAFEGRLGASVEVLAEAVSVYLELSLAVEKIYTFAHLLSDSDTSNSTHLGMLQQAMSLYTEFSTHSSYLTPELLSLEESLLEDFLRSEKLRPYKRMIQEIIRFKPHTLSKPEENLLAMGTEVFGAAENIFSQLENADLEFGTVKVEEEEVTLTHSSFIQLLKNPARAVRRVTYEQFYDVFNKHRHALSASLNASIKKDIFLTRARKHPSALEKSLFPDNVEKRVYENLISAVSGKISPLHDYYQLRAKALKLEGELQIYDTYIPLVTDIETNNSYEQAVTLILDSLAPLGEEYCSILKSGLTTDRWVDRYENKGKRSGAYSSGCYTSPPYILMNYKDTVLNDVFTLTHEAGHSMHSYYSRKHQSYQDHGYTIFVAEVASTLNEQLLLAHLKKLHAGDARFLSFLLNHQIDDMKSTFFRQTMFAEFEKITHEQAEEGMPLTVETFREIYSELLKKYFGPAVLLHELSGLEFLRIPHFYSAFYVYKYATGLTASTTLATRILEGDTAALERYLTFLKSGCTKPPLELLKDAGVDLTTPEPVEGMLSHFETLVDRLSENIA